MYIEWLDWYFDMHELIAVLVKMVLALLCGGVLGVERGRKKRPAGLRTYMLVCLGATLVMMTNAHLAEAYGVGDMGRMGAQVVSGIGFLGAGTIITTGHNRVKGLTTAAGLWASACIGLAIGSGYYEGAIIGTLMIVLIMVVLHNFDRRVARTTKMLILYVEADKMSSIRRTIKYAREHDIEVESVEIEKPDNTMVGKTAAVMTWVMPAKSAHADLIDQISALDGIRFVEEL